MDRPVVLMTGAAQGIGRVAAESFSAEGWQVVAADYQQAEGYSENVAFQLCNVSEPEQVSTLIESVRKKFGRLDSLVNNAAIQVSKPFLETTMEEWDAVMSVNLRAVFLMTQAAHPMLKETGGSIVNVSSVHALATSTEIAAYATSKGGLLALTRALAIEFATDNIRVNAVLPGAVDTEMLREGLTRNQGSGESVEERLEALGARTVMGRVGEPWEIARAILFLADGDQSSFMTGSALVVDGGATVRLSTE
jgi:NAD(P)-dependent dehydrogenase (short-subunit alcohol dehydrogenase family)